MKKSLKIFKIELWTRGTIAEIFFAENSFLGFENNKVLFHATRNLHRMTIYLT